MVTSFTHYTGEYGESIFNADVGLYGRYILNMDVKVTFDKTRTKIVNYNEPEFSFVEVAKVGTAANGEFLSRRMCEIPDPGRPNPAPGAATRALTDPTSQKGAEP